jgi:hypothetical protein
VSAFKKVQKAVKVRMATEEPLMEGDRRHRPCESPWSRSGLKRAFGVF